MSLNIYFNPHMMAELSGELDGWCYGEANLASNAREIVDFMLRDLDATHHIAPYDFDAPDGLRQWLMSHDFEAKAKTETHHITVSPEAKSKLISEHDLSESDFVTKKEE